MYEDTWYSFVPEPQSKKGPPTPGHRRKESLLQQPNGLTGQPADATEPLEGLYEEDENDNSPPEPTLSRRAKSYSDFYDIVTEQIAKDAGNQKKRRRRKDRTIDALSIQTPALAIDGHDEPLLDLYTDELLQASQEEHRIYRDQLAMTERHLDTLIEDTDAALELLSSLAGSFRAVEDQTTSFQAQCDDLLSEQKRLQKLADHVGTDLHYYEYLDNVTRRLNAAGASRLVEDDAFGEVLENLDACIVFMTKNPTYRDAESYLTRYQALLTKALHLLEAGFRNRLDKVSSEIGRQIAATQSESARHALAYGRFEEVILGAYSLVPNVQKVISKAFDRHGLPTGQHMPIYTSTAKDLLSSFLLARDRDVKPLVQADAEAFKAEVKSASAETACRSFIKQCFERSYDEAALFTKVSGMELQYSTNAESAFVAIKTHRSDLVNGVNVVPIATQLQAVLAPVELQIVCNVLGWVTNEYLLADYDDEETALARHCRELTARLLTEHLWTFTDACFEAEIAKYLSKAPVFVEALKIAPVTAGVASSNAYPPVKKALELLVMFDQAMPKERCQRNSPVVFKVVKESIAALQRAESRFQTTKGSTDPDLFMIKNLLILKNELLSLEIGDVRSQESSMQHFGQIWDALSLAQNWVGYFSSFIPGSSLWGGATPARAKGAAAGATNDQQDASEQLDDLLRRSIVAFTQRWASLINDAVSKKLGGKNLAKIERDLEEMLQAAFSNQPEVVAKLKEAIQINAQGLKSEQKGSKISTV